MNSSKINKGIMNMTTKKLITVLTAMLLVVLPINGLASVANAAGADLTLKTFEINGQAVEDGDTFIVPKDTTTVTVNAVANDPNANVNVTGASGLKSGDNDVIVTVTGSDSSQATYTVDVYVSTVGVEFSTDTSLSSVNINGNAVTPGQLIDVPAQTDAVRVVVVPNDVNATSVVSGATNLVTGINSVTVTVTAEDGTTNKSYIYKVRVAALSADVALETFKVNGQNVRNNSRIFLAPHTDHVAVIAVPNDPTSSVEITGQDNLVDGANTLNVKVTALGGNVFNYVVTLNVETPSNVSSLVQLKVNGARATDGGTVLLPARTTEVTVIAIPSDGSAQVEVTGRTGLVKGDNPLTVVVTAEDGSQTTYTSTLRVLADDDTSLDIFQYDGEDVESGAEFDLENGTTSVDTSLITATPVSPTAAVSFVGADNLKTGRNVVKVVVTAEDGSIQSYKLIFNVAYSSNTEAEITVNGESVADGDSVSLLPGTGKVAVRVVTADDNATFSIEGATGLETGDNELKVTVTAEDGTENTYSITLVVLPSDVAYAKSFTINGETIKPNGKFTVDPYTEAVEVVAVALDETATYEVTGADELQVGENTVTVVLTAQDGTTTQTYIFTVDVLASTDTSLSEFTVNGSKVTDGATVTLEPYTDSVEVVATPTDEHIEAVIAGDSGLVNGSNDLVVTVTAQDGTVKKYTLKLIVPLSPDTSLASFNVGGIDVVTGDTVTVDPYSTETDVTAEANDTNATVLVTGGTDLVVGNNTVTVKVTAVDGSIKIYTVTVVVPKGNDTSLATFTVNGEDVEDGATFDLEPYSTGFEVVVETTDPNASFVVDKPVSLAYGPNVLKVVVTAQNGVDTSTSLVTVNLPLGNDVTLSKFQVNGNDVADGDQVELPYLTKTATIVAVPTDAKASVLVTGGTNLVSGENTVTAKVTAHDGTEETYTITLIVRLSNVTSLSVFKVNNADVVDDAKVTLAPFTKSVTVVATATDADATLEIEGGVDLEPEDNELVVTVTAADGETIQVYTVHLYVELNHDATLSVFTVNGNAVTDGQVIDLPPYTDSVDVVATPTDVDATVELEGGEDLVYGENSLKVTVTAADGTTIAVSTIKLKVALGNSTDLNVFSVNGDQVKDGDTITLHPYDDSVELEVETADENATYVATGDSELVDGSNQLVVTVKAQDGTVKVYKVTLIVPLSGDADAIITVNGDEAADNSTVILEAYTTEVEVGVELSDENSKVETSGGTGLVTGDNILKVKVTAPDGTVKTYTINLKVSLSSDTSLETFTVNGNDVADGDTIDLDPYATEVTVGIVTTDALASYVISGDTDLVEGRNTLTVTVTAVNGDKLVYSVVMVVPSSDTSLSSLKVNGVEVVDGEVIDFPAYTASAAIVAIATFEGANVEIEGGDSLEAGENVVTVTVTAANGVDVATYTLTLNVLLSDNVDLAVFKVNGVDVLTLSDASISLPAYSTEAEVDVQTVDENATFEITGAEDLVFGGNVLTVVVTAPSGDTYEYSVVLDVALGDRTDAVITVGDVTVVDGDVVSLDPYTAEVEVAVELGDENATYAVTGESGLVTGINQLVVTVTAQDGKSKAYKVTLLVILSSDTSVESISVNGDDVSDGDVYDLEAYTTDADIAVVTTDPNATYVKTGGSGLKTGLNDASVTVTAPDGTKQTYSFKLNVVLSNETGIDQIIVYGDPVEEGGTLELPSGTSAIGVTVITKDKYAQVEISGNEDLQAGENTVTVTVTAPDGTVEEHTFTANVAVLSGDFSIESLSVWGQEYGDGEMVEVPAGTKAVRVGVITTDPMATYTIEGAEDLQPGDNTVTITVIAPNGDDGTYQLLVKVLSVQENTDTGVESISVAGNDVADGDVVTVDAGIRGVEVLVVTSDPFATFTVSGNSPLEPGENTVEIVVTAGNGDSATYSVTVVVKEVAPKKDVTLESVSIAGKDNVKEGEIVDVPAGTRAVPVVVVTNDPFATYEVQGDVDLEPGDSDLTITVTAGDGETTAEYVYKLKVAASPLGDDTSLAVLQVNSKDVADGDSLDLPFGTKRVNVKAETTDPLSTYMVEGDGSVTPLVEGEQELVITVTAPNGDTATNTITLNVLALSKNNNLDADAGLTINGESVDLELLNSDRFYSVDRTVTTLSVKAKAEDSTADVLLNGKDLLPDVARNVGVAIGVNAIVFTVIPQDVAETKTYTLKVFVGGADVSLKTTKIGSTAITFVNGEATTATLPNGTTTATLYIEPTMPMKAAGVLGPEVEINGDGITATKAAAAFTWTISGLISGDNPLTITVKPGDPDAESADYNLTIPVALSSDKSLKTFKIDGKVYPVGSTQIFPIGTEYLELDAETTHPNATFEVEGGDALVPGINVLTVTVTAEDGVATGIYTIKAIVPKAKETIVVGFPKANVVTVDAKTNAAGNKVLAAAVKKLTGLKATLVKVEIANDFVIAKESNKKAGAARAASLQTFLKAAKLTNAKTALYSLIPFKLPKAKGATVNIYYY